MRGKVLLIVAVVLLLAVVVFTAFLSIEPNDQTKGEAPPPSASLGATTLDRGRALVTLGDCRPCHTVQGGKDFAGGRAIPTPFGTFYSPNITPDQQTGLGAWSSDDFWRALHNGISRDGRPLYPTFPYTNYTKVSRRDADDMFAYLRTLQPVQQPARAHELSFPYDKTFSLKLWRRAFFRPGVYRPDASRSAEWNRGAYIVEGLAHCSACHEARNSLGAAKADRNPAGGLVLNWYAPSLARPEEAGLHDWQQTEIATFLRTGRLFDTASAPSHAASALGPMADVVYESLQHVPSHEINAMAAYLRSLPKSDVAPDQSGVRRTDNAAILDSGRKIYADRCARCHGDNGEGKAPAALPLAGNRALTMSNATNAIRIVLYGGYPPGTAGNPRPFGMPPFADTLSSVDIADVLTFARSTWSNNAGAVTPTQVARNRTGPQW